MGSLKANVKGALTKAEKFYIEQHKPSMSAIEIAKDLGRSLYMVEKYYKAYRVPDPATTMEAKQPAKQKSRAFKSFINKTGGDKSGVVIATAASSAHGDSEPGVSKPAPAHDPKVVFRPKGDIVEN